MALDVELLKQAGLTEEQIQKVVRDHQRKEKSRILDEVLSAAEIKPFVEKMKTFSADFTVSLRKKGSEVQVSVR